MRFEETDTVMRLEQQSTIDAYTQAGFWQDQTLDASLRDHAAARGEDIALVDAPDRSRWTGGAPRTLSFADFDRDVSKAAAAFQAIGLEPGSVVAIQSPATSDAIIAHYGALRAGLIVFQIPLLWRSRDMIACLKQASARAVIVADRYQSEDLALEMRDAVAEVFCVRYMFGLGDQLADGVIDLMGLCAEIDATEIEPLADANAVATVSVAVDADGSKVMVPRTHNHWLCAVRHLSQTVESASEITLSTLHPSSFAGLAAGIMQPLHAGHKVHLHSFSGPNLFAAEVARTGATMAVVPAPIAGHLCALLDETDNQQTALAIVSTEQNEARCPLERERTIFDVVSLSDIALHSILRSSSETRLPLPIARLSSAENGSSLLHTRLRARMRKASSNSTLLGGELQIAGAMVPTRDWPRGNEDGFGKLRSGADGFVSTDIGCDLAGANAHEATVNGRIACANSIGSQIVSQSQIEALYGDIATIADVAILFEPHEIAGRRIIAYAVPSEGAMVDTASVCDQLRKLGAPRHLMPQSVVSLHSIPRNEDGTIAVDLLSGSMAVGAEAILA